MVIDKKYICRLNIFLKISLQLEWISILNIGIILEFFIDKILLWNSINKNKILINSKKKKEKQLRKNKIKKYKIGKKMIKNS